MKYPLSSSTWGIEEEIAISDILKSGNFTMGRKVQEFEQNFSDYFGSKYAVMCNSGSSANLLMVTALMYRKSGCLLPDDEVLVPAVSWSTTYYPIHQNGLVMNFVDIDLESLNIDLDLLENKITKKTKAILAVNLLGNPVNYKHLIEFSERNNLILLEDNCESLGASIENQRTGTFGLAGSTSFFYSHHISTMEGGCVLTDDQELYQIMKSIRAHGWTRDLPSKNLVFEKTGTEWDDLFRFVLPGYNLRPLEIEAAIGIEQLKKLDLFVQNRRSNAMKFRELLSAYPKILIQKEFGKSSWFGFSMILQEDWSSRRDEFVSHLERYEIQSRPIVAGNFARNPVLKHLRHKEITDLSRADVLHEQGLFIGNHHYLMEDEFELLASALRTFN